MTGVFDEEVLGCCIRGEDMETFPEDPFEMVKSRIVSGDEESPVKVGTHILLHYIQI